MTTNLTIDDSSSDIIYSSNWATQSDYDPDTYLFFQSTYHSAQADGGSANLTFTGSAVYLFGSKGPEHANYSVQFDNYIIFYSAMMEETKYQEPLFGFTFNNSGTHFISLTSHHVPDGKWLDLDYITITVNDTESGPAQGSSTFNPSASQTIVPPWLSSLNSSLPTSTETGSAIPPTSSSSASSSSTSRLTLILSIVFGTLLVAALLLSLGFCLVRRKQRRPAARADAIFEYKPAPSSVAVPMSPMQLSPALAVPDVYTAQSPMSRADPFYRDPAAVEHQLHDGRRSPWSAYSQGGTTVLTAASSTRLLNAHPHEDSHSQPHTQAKVQMHVPSPSLLPAPEPMHQCTFHSDSGIVTGTGGAMSSVAHLPQTTETGGQPLPRPPPLYANHSDSMFSATPRPAPPPPPPKRPKRPAEGLLDWLGNGIGLERSSTAKRRRDDGNSERTNFLKV